MRAPAQVAVPACVVYFRCALFIYWRLAGARVIGRAHAQVASGLNDAVRRRASMRQITAAPTKSPTNCAHVNRFQNSFDR